MREQLNKFFYLPPSDVLVVNAVVFAVTFILVIYGSFAKHKWRGRSLFKNGRFVTINNIHSSFRVDCFLGIDLWQNT